MDPLSATASVAGLLSLTIELTKIVSEYCRGVANAPRNASDLLNELASLHDVLRRLGDFLEHHRATSVGFDSSSALLETSAVCRNRLLELLERFQKVKAKKLSLILQRLIWPLEEKETTRVVEALHRWTQTFSLSLTIDGCNLLSKSTSEIHSLLETSRNVYNTTKTLPLLASSTEETLKVVQRLELIAESSSSDVLFSLRRVEHLIAGIHNQAIDARWYSFLEWLSDNRHENKHQDLQEKRVEGTGEWLLQEALFESWRSEEDLHSHVLWCHGIPGAGKTFLVSLIVDHVKSTPEMRRVAYFYFEYQYEERHKPVVLICSLIKQLLQYDDSSALSQDFASLRKRLNGDRNFTQMVHDFEKNRFPSGQDQLMEILLKIVKLSTRPFIIVDALDECEPQQNRKDVMSILEQLSTCSKVLIASRSHLSIESKMSGCGKIAIEASKADIDLFLRKKLDEDETFTQMVNDHDDNLDTLKEEIIEVIVRKSQGMFFLPVLQLENILEQVTPAGMRDALGEAPDGLNAVFRLTLKRIARQPRPRVELAHAVITWIAYAERPLAASELQHAIAIKPGIRAWSPDLVSSVNLFKQHCVQFCFGLVTVDSGSIVNFVHFSLAEYFLKEKASIFPFAEKMMAQACLRYLGLNELQGSTPQSSTLMHQFAFLDYAARHWGNHSRKGCDNEVLQDAVVFLSNQSVRPLLKTLGTIDGTIELYSPLHIAAFHGLHLVVTYYLTTTSIDADSVCGALTPLQIAACRGHHLVVKLLLERDYVNPNRVFSMASPLQTATWNGDIATVKSLVTCNQVDIDFAPFQPTALVLAAARRHWSIVELLFLKGASVNSRDYDGKTVMHHAIAANEETVVRSLLQRTDIDLSLRDEDGVSVLHLTITRQRSQITKSLLSGIIDPNMQDNAGRTSLWLACHQQQLEATLLLLHDRRIDPNIVGPKGDSPLLVAVCKAAEEEGLDAQRNDSRRMSLKILKALVGCPKVNINSRNTNGTTALHVAASHSETDLVRLMLSRADLQVNSQDDYGQTSIHRAAANSSSCILSLLIKESNLDLWKKDSRGRNGLHHAAKYGMHHNIRLLFEQSKTEVNEADVHGMTPLHYAAAANCLRCIEDLLLNHKTQVNSQNDNGDTPLHCAVFNVAGCILPTEHKNDLSSSKESSQATPVFDNGNAVTLLGTQKETELNRINSRGMTSLHLAAFLGKDDAVQFLMQLSDIEINPRDADGRTPLHLACCNNKSIVLQKMLCYEECEKNAQDNEGNTPLHCSTARGYVEPVQVLLGFDDIKIDAKNNHGETAIHLAVNQNDTSLVQLLLKPRTSHNGILKPLSTGDVNDRDRFGNTPLHTAVSRNKIDAAKYLLQHPNIDINCQNNIGETPLHIAAGFGFSSMAECLFRHEDIEFSRSDIYGLRIIDVVRGPQLPFRLSQIGWDPTFHGRRKILKMLFQDNRAWVDPQLRRFRSLDNLC